MKPERHVVGKAAAATEDFIVAAGAFNSSAAAVIPALLCVTLSIWFTAALICVTPSLCSSAAPGHFAREFVHLATLGHEVAAIAPTNRAAAHFAARALPCTKVRTSAAMTAKPIPPSLMVPATSAVFKVRMLV